MKLLLTYTLLLTFTVGFTWPQKEFLCPPAEKLTPCKCVKECEQQCEAVIACVNITTQIQIENVISRTGDFPFRTTVFDDSVLQYIPRILFETKKVRNLFIRHSHLNTIIDATPRGNSTLEEAWLESVHIKRGFQFQAFAPFKLLVSLYVGDIEVKRIPNGVGDYLSPKLLYLQFVNTRTSKVGNTAFAAFSSLELLVISQGRIATVSGSMFPKSLVQLVLSQNRIKSLPSGFADHLTKLERIYLDGNQLSHLEESVFGHIKTLTHLSVEDNPIICDCTLRWMLSENVAIEGKCEDPKNKKISDITAKDLEYC